MVVCFYGYIYYDDYFMDKYGIYYLIFDGVIIVFFDFNVFVILYVNNDVIIIEGFGVIESRVLKYFY